MIKNLNVLVEARRNIDGTTMGRQGVLIDNVPGLRVLGPTLSAVRDVFPELNRDFTAGSFVDTLARLWPGPSRRLSVTGLDQLVGAADWYVVVEQYASGHISVLPYEVRQCANPRHFMLCARTPIPLKRVEHLLGTFLFLNPEYA